MSCLQFICLDVQYLTLPASVCARVVYTKLCGRPVACLIRLLSTYSHATRPSLAQLTPAAIAAAPSTVCAYLPPIALRSFCTFRTDIRRQTWRMRLRCSSARRISFIVISSGSPFAMNSTTNGREVNVCGFPWASMAGIVRVPQFGNHLRHKSYPLCLSASLWVTGNSHHGTTSPCRLVSPFTKHRLAFLESRFFWVQRSPSQARWTFVWIQ
jgi:hypothetical protein